MQTNSNWQSINGNLHRFVQMTPSESDIKTIRSDFRNGISIGAANHRHNMIELFGLQMSFVRCVRAAAVEQNIASTFRNSRLPLALVQQQNFFDISRNPINSYKRKEGVITHREFFFFLIYSSAQCVCCSDCMVKNNSENLRISANDQKLTEKLFISLIFSDMLDGDKHKWDTERENAMVLLMCRKIINKKNEKNEK